MDKRTPNKRKSLANTGTTPTKFQKTGNTPDKKNKSPKAGKKSPQKKQLNGKQNTLKEKKVIKTETEEEDFLNDSEENETEESFEQEKEEMNGNSDNSDAENDSDDEDDNNEDDDDDDDDDEEDDDETETKPKVKAEKNATENDRKFSLFVGGLDFNTKESDIRSLFDKDSILAVNILINKVTNKSRGCAFVNFKSEAAMKKGLSKNGTNLKGRIIKVSVPQKTNKNDKKRIILEKLKLKIKKLEQELAGSETKPTLNKKFNKKGKKAGK